MARTIVVFDLDDTLYPERDFAVSGFAAAAAWAKEQFGCDGLAEEMTRLLDDGHLGSLFAAVLSRHAPGHTSDHLEAFIEAYRSHQPTLRLYEDAREALAHFEARGPLGLITDGTHGVQQAKVRALGLEGRFQHIGYTHALGGRAFSKPHPLAYENAERALGAPGDRFVYVGDNPSKDFVTPNARGWLTVQIRRPSLIHRNARVAEGGAPHHTVDALTELPKLIGR